MTFWLVLKDQQPSKPEEEEVEVTVSGSKTGGC